MKIDKKILANIISESINKVLKEENNAFDISRLEELVGYHYDNEEPKSFLRDYELTLEEVMDVARYRAEGDEEWVNKSHYKDIDLNELLSYIEPMRQKLEMDLQNKFEEIKKEYGECNAILNGMIEKYSNFKQGKKYYY